MRGDSHLRDAGHRRCRRAGRRPALLDPAAAERQALIERWAERHGVDAARRLAEAEDLADAVAAEITPNNTVDTYDKSWRVWERFCAAATQPGRRRSPPPGHRVASTCARSAQRPAWR
ncbi:hypothetical protein ACIGG5_33885 [Streptomyces sp. NPDC085463]|uniref:hypothetical protein n=1 Tax=Streptomyces sp. NPDC085463 TaxID=3365724 RepID=UPI0037CE0AD8